MSPLSTSSSGSTRSNSRCSSSVIATPSSSRSSPVRHVPLGRTSSLNGARWAASSPQRMPLARTHSSICPSLSSSKPKRRRTGSRPARSSTCEAVRRSPASSSRRAATPSTGLVWRSERSARRTRRSDSSPVPNVAWISGAKVSMSGHMTITSRGSSVGSSASSCRIAARRTSTWRARPWQEWIWMLRSIGVVAGASSFLTRRLEAVQQACRRRSRPGGGGRRTRRARAGARGCRGPTRRAAGSAGAPPSRPRGGGAPSGAPATFSHSAGDGCSRKRWTSRAAASAARTSTWPRGRRVSPNTLRRGGRSARSGWSRRRAHARARRSAGSGSPMRARSRR